MSESDAYTDVVELCALLECLGFSIKSLDTTDSNVSQDGSTRTVTINCQASGFHVVMESANVTCSCPCAPNQQNSGIWQVSGVTGGKQYNKVCGSNLLGSIPKPHRERLTKELQGIIRCIKEHNESDGSKEAIGNKSASMIELKTPEKGLPTLKVDTPTRYRSLDTLTTKDNGQLPAPGPLQKQLAEENVDSKRMMCQRQSTYTLSSTPDSSSRRNKTSSPIQVLSNSMLDSLIAAEKSADELRKKLSNIIKEYYEDNKLDTSMSSLALDVSKISVLKGPDCSKSQFASSPNLLGLGAQDDFLKRPRGVESVSTSNLAPKSSTKDGKTSKLRRITPNVFKLRNSPSVAKTDKPNDNKSSKLNSLFRPKVVAPVKAINQQVLAGGSPNVSASNKKFTNVKSTIPRLASKKE